MFLKHIKLNKLLNFRNSNILNCRHVSYVQGQEPEPKIREYFYYIDHEGMLFLDDAKLKNFTNCYKERQFLKFFFLRLKMNDTKRYAHEFPYLALCGRERNFIRCEDTPIVFTQILHDDNRDKISYAHADELLTVDFEPSKIYMNPRTGRVYHPAMERAGSIGLICSKLAISLSTRFDFGNGEEKPPTHIHWRGECLEIDNSWIPGTQRYCAKFSAEQKKKYFL